MGGSRKSKYPHHIGIQVSEAQRDAMYRICATKGMTLSEVIRKAINEYLKRAGVNDERRGA